MTGVAGHYSYSIGLPISLHNGDGEGQNPVSGETEKQASQIVDQMRLGGVNLSELARLGLREKLRETLSDSPLHGFKISSDLSQLSH